MFIIYFSMNYYNLIRFILIKYNIKIININLYKYKSILKITKNKHDTQSDIINICEYYYFVY